MRSEQSGLPVESGRIVLLVTDVVMTRMGGREASEPVVDLALGFKVLFLSGYIDAVIRHSSPGAEVAFRQKPFSPAFLARKEQAFSGAQAKTVRHRRPTQSCLAFDSVAHQPGTDAGGVYP